MKIVVWGVLILILCFWGVIAIDGAYTVADVGGPVALWVTTIVIVVWLLMQAGWQINQQWLGVLIDNRNKISLARLQVALWTVIVMSAYLIMALARIGAVPDGLLTQEQALNITFPPELLLAMGISAASFAGSTLIKQTKTTKTMVIEAKSTPDSAEKYLSEAKAAFEAAEKEIVKKAQAELDAKAEFDQAAAAAKAAAAGAAKEAAEKERVKKEMLYKDASQEKNDTVKALNERKKEREAAEKDLAVIKEAQGLLHRNAEPSEASWVDLFRGEEIGNYKLVDMSKVQMMFFTIVVIVAYTSGIVTILQGTLVGADELSFPPFGDTLNALLGISHGTYLSVKAVDHK